MSILIFNGYCVSFFVVEENKEKRNFKQIFLLTDIRWIVDYTVKHISIFFYQNVINYRYKDIFQEKFSDKQMSVFTLILGRFDTLFINCIIILFNTAVAELFIMIM